MNAAVEGDVIARPKFLKKITPKTITDEIGVKMADREWVATQLKAPLALYDLFGVISNTKTGHTDKGDWVAFVGRFKAVAPNGQEFDSGKAHIPVLEDVIYSTLAEAQEGGQKATIRVAVRIGIKPAPKDKPSATGYEYWAERLVDLKGDDDPIAMLRAEAGQRALAAPKPDPAPAAAPAPEAHKGGHKGK